MFINELQYERYLLENTLNHHLNKLYARDNPKGILLCQKNKKSFRWQHKYLLDGRPVTVNLRKADAPLAEKLAVNLYRIVCIQYLQVQIISIDNLIRSRLSGKPLEINRPTITDKQMNVDKQTKNSMRPGADRQMGSSRQMGADMQMGAGRQMGADMQMGAGRQMGAARQMGAGMQMGNGRQMDTGRQMEVAVGSLLAENPLRVLLHKVQNYPRVPADFFHSESPYRTFILSHLWREYAEVIDWYLGDFRQYAEYPEYRQFRIKLGYNVRSKSEVIAANRLHEEGILFHYEEILVAGDDEFPDFFMMISVVEKYAWEHFGAMDNEKYHSRQRVKIMDYLDHQWFPGINMITTYETKQHPLTEEQVDHQIRWLKIRYRIAFPDLPPDESFNMYDLAGYVKRYRAGQ